MVKVELCQKNNSVHTKEINFHIFEFCMLPNGEVIFLLVIRAWNTLFCITSCQCNK